MTPLIITVWIFITSTFFFSSKMIAMETLLIFQFTYGGIIMMRKIEPLMIPYKKLWVFNGYNQNNQLGDSFLPPNIKIMGYGSEFFSNFNFGIVFLLLPALGGLVLYIVYKILIRMRKSNRLDYYSEIALGEWQICGLLFSLQQVTFAFIINVMYG